MDESKLKPFDLEAAKRGEAVLALLYGDQFEVIAAAWVPSDSGYYPVLIRYADGVASWRCLQAKDIRMAPRTRKVWYGLARSKDGRRIYPVADNSEEALREWVESGGEILAIHSIEVPE